MPAPRSLDAPQPDLARGFAVLIAITTALIVLGALVRAHAAGLACPDWPLCFGQVVPEFDLRVAFEWSHRLLASFVSLLFVGLSALVFRRTAAGHPARRRIAFAGLLLAAQVLLGALTVWSLLAKWSVTAHLLAGNSFNAALLWIALALRGTPPREVTPRTARVLVIVVAALLVSQLALGGLVSSGYAGLACPEWPTCTGGEWFPAWGGAVGIHLHHRVNAYLLVIALAAAAFACRKLAQLRALTALAVALGFAQACVGVSNVLLGLPVEVTALHSALAALLVLAVAASVHALGPSEVTT